MSLPVITFHGIILPVGHPGEPWCLSYVPVLTTPEYKHESRKPLPYTSKSDLQKRLSKELHDRTWQFDVGRVAEMLSANGLDACELSPWSATQSTQGTGTWLAHGWDGAGVVFPYFDIPEQLRRRVSRCPLWFQIICGGNRPSSSFL